MLTVHDAEMKKGTRGAGSRSRPAGGRESVYARGLAYATLPKDVRDGRLGPERRPTASYQSTLPNVQTSSISQGTRSGVAREPSRDDRDTAPLALVRRPESRG